MIKLVIITMVLFIPKISYGDFDSETLSQAAFKRLFGKTHTEQKHLANESIPSTYTLSSAKVFAETIPLTAPATHTSIMVVCADSDESALKLVEIAASNGNSYEATVPNANHQLTNYTNPTTGAAYASGDRVSFTIPSSFGTSYRPILYDNSVEVPPLDASDWFLDENAGVIHSETDLGLSTTGTLDAWVYVGKMVNSFHPSYDFMTPTYYNKPTHPGLVDSSYVTATYEPAGSIPDSSFLTNTYHTQAYLTPTYYNKVVHPGLVDSSFITETKQFITNTYTPRNEWLQNGFPAASDVTITWYDVTRTLYISPTGTDFSYTLDGILYTESDAIYETIADSTNLWVFYISAEGVMDSIENPNESQVDSIIENECIVAFVYWNTAASISDGKLFHELHGNRMSPHTHHWIHDNIGAVYKSGMALSDFVVDQNGDDNEDAQFSVASGEFYDEDVEHDMGAVAKATGIEIWSLDGGDWQWYTNAGFSVTNTYGLNDRLAWNDGGTQAEVDNNDFVLCHIFATNISNDYGVGRKYIAIQGQAEYNTKGQAREGAETEINDLTYGNLPLPELVPIATIIFQSGNGYNNDVKAKIVSTDAGDNYIDWRGSGIKATGGSVADHGALAGLADDDHTQYYKDGDITNTYWTTDVSADNVIDGVNLKDDTVDSQHYVAGSIDEEHLNSTNEPTDNYVLSYNLAGTNFTWIEAAAGGGDAWSDPVDSSLIPDADNTYDIGSSGYEFKDGYFDGTLEADEITEGGSAVFSSGEAATFSTVNTGQGAYELYAMNQDVESTDAVTFLTVDTGQGANELYTMNQDVESTDTVTFDAVTTDLISDAGDIDFQPSGDSDDYFTMKTTSNTPTFLSTGGGMIIESEDSYDIHLKPSSGIALITGAISETNSHGPVLPEAKSLPPGYTFLHTTTGRSILYTSDGSNWTPVQSIGTMVLYVDATDGENILGTKGTGVDGDAFATIQFAWDAIPPIFNGDVTININSEIYEETLELYGKTPGGPYSITFEGTLSASVDDGTAEASSSKGAASTRAHVDDANEFPDSATGMLLNLDAGGDNDWRIIRSIDAGEDIATLCGMTTSEPDANAWAVYEWATEIDGKGSTTILLDGQKNVIFKNIKFSSDGSTFLATIQNFSTAEFWYCHLEGRVDFRLSKGVIDTCYFNTSDNVINLYSRDSSLIDCFRSLFVNDRQTAVWVFIVSGINFGYGSTIDEVDNGADAIRIYRNSVGVIYGGGTYGNAWFENADNAITSDYGGQVLGVGAAVYLFNNGDENAVAASYGYID